MGVEVIGISTLKYNHKRENVMENAEKNKGKRRSRKAEKKAGIFEIQKAAFKEFLSPVGLTLPSKTDTLKGTAVVLISMTVCSFFVAGVDTLTAFIVSKF